MLWTRFRQLFSFLHWELVYIYSREKTSLIILKEKREGKIMIVHHTVLRENEDLPLWEALVSRQRAKASMFYERALITREIMRSNEPVFDKGFFSPKGGETKAFVKFLMYPWSKLPFTGYKFLLFLFVNYKSVKKSGTGKGVSVSNIPLVWSAVWPTNKNKGCKYKTLSPSLFL